MLTSNIIVLLFLVSTGAGRKLTVRGDDTNISSRYRRAACQPIFSTLDAGHTMCIDDESAAVPDEFTEDEIETIVNQHNEFRSQAEAEGMIKLYWDENIAIIAQKWANQCGPIKHEANSILRATPSLNGIVMGQNIAMYSGGSLDYRDATIMWHAEIKDFVYDQGASPPEAVIGHYTQVLREDAARLGCGRTRCEEDGRMNEYVVCNYATGQTGDQKKRPYEQCLEQSCKTNCLKRDDLGLCDCDGKICLNGGTLDKETCTCACVGPFTGDNCETVSCDGATDKSFCTEPSYCQYANIVADCPLFCNICPTSCTKICQNGGTQNSVPCLCNCLPDWTGDLCETPVDAAPTCSLTCTQPEVLDVDNCLCLAPTCSLTCTQPEVLDVDNCLCLDTCGFIRLHPEYNLCATYWGAVCNC